MRHRPTRGIWPNGKDPWKVWNMRPAMPAIQTQEETSEADRKPSQAVASIAGKILAGQEATQAETKSLAASVLSQRNG